MSLAPELKEVIVQALSEKQVVSLPEIIARFDWKMRTIPSENEFKWALEKIETIYLSKDEKGMLQFSSQDGVGLPTKEVAEEDLKVAFNSYKKQAWKK